MTSRRRQHKPIDLQHLAAVLGGIECVEYAIVSGSFAHGIVRAGSDLDITIPLAQANTRSIDRLLEIVGKIE